MQRDLVNMSKILLSYEVIKILSTNKWIRSVSEKSITYTDEFKQEISGKVLLTDITYLLYDISNMAYLSTIKNGSTNEILSYNLSKTLTLDIAT
jgi:hypothetical protein